ncbi:MAG: TPR end-of-group domain-containing protein [Chitinophagales bacterium]
MKQTEQTQSTNSTLYTFFFTFICLLFTLQSASIHAQTTVNELYQVATKAYEEKDFKTFLQHCQSMDSIRDNHPTILYNLACAYSLNQNEAKAVQTLEKLLLIDAKEQIREEADLDNIRESEGFKRILAKMDSIAIPVIQSDTAMVIPVKNLHPESIAFDAKTGDFYLSGFHLRKIIRINSEGNVSDFIEEAEDGIWAVSGIKIDTVRRWLWATTVAAPQMIDFEESKDGQTGIFKYDLDSGELLKKYLLKEEEAHWFGDLEIHPDGTVYATDSKQPYIYCIKITPDSLELFVNHSDFVSLQGITFNDSTSYLFVADYRNGIFKIELASQEIQSIVAPKNTSLKGIDGMYFHKNSLITIQNGLRPMRVMRHYFEEDQLIFKHSQIIDHHHPAFDEPTLGVIVGSDFFYIANSPWAKYEKDGTMFSEDKLGNIVILKTALPY